MKKIDVFVSNTKISEPNKMTTKQAKYLQFLFKDKAVDNPFVSYNDMKARLSKLQAHLTIEAIKNEDSIVWIIPME